MDFVLVTKTSYDVITEEKSKDNIVKQFPKYQYQSLMVNNAQAT